MMTKRIAALAMALVLALGLAACGKAPQSASSKPSGTGLFGQPLEDSSPDSTEPLFPAAVPEDTLVLDALPLATEVDALTGLARAEGMAEGARPVAVMVANDIRAYPQRGLAAADVLVETVTEGGITRLMAMYSDYRTVPQVGPVRSTRDQFIQLAVPFDPIMVHIGTSVYARNLLSVMAFRDLDGMYLGKTSFWFDTARNLPKPGGKMNEYCWFTDAGLIWAGMETLDLWTTGEIRTLFRFAGQPAASAEAAMRVTTKYSEQTYVDFYYNTETGNYDKTAFGGWHTDEDGTPLSYKNLILLTCDVGLKEDGMCTDILFGSGGTGYYVTGGQVTSVSWVKSHPKAPLRLIESETGRELEVQPGKSYVGFYPVSVENPILCWSAQELAEAEAAANEAAAGEEVSQ